MKWTDEEEPYVRSLIDTFNEAAREHGLETALNMLLNVLFLAAKTYGAEMVGPPALAMLEHMAEIELAKLKSKDKEQMH